MKQVITGLDGPAPSFDALRWAADPAARTGADLTDDPLPEWLSPLVSIVPAQLFCYHLARAKGCDTEQPRGLSKVTRTV